MAWQRDKYMRYWWNKKFVVITMHIIDELDRQNKTVDFLGDMMEKGDHKIISKKQRKYECKLRVGKTIWKLIYVSKEDKVFMIHLKPE